MSSFSIHGDWGTTRLRLWRIEHGAVTDSLESAGIGGLVGDPADVLRKAIAPWTERSALRRIVMCGMVGARNGLHEVPYVDCPVGASSWRASATGFEFDGVPLRIMAGVACREGGRADVMRGEETQIFGAMKLCPSLSEGRHVAVLPGTHSKWAGLGDGRINAFRTFLTGELYQLLQGSSLLAGGRENKTDSVDEGFDTGLDRAEAFGLLGSLFEARAAQLRDGRSADWARAFLSGLVLGSELAEMRRSGSLPGRVAVIGGAELAGRYALALARFGVKTELIDGDACAQAGLELGDADD